MKRRAPSRTLTTFAVGFLLLDAVLLAFGAIAFDRPWLGAAAVVFGGAALLVILAWRRYRRTVAELDEARREMKREVEEIRALLQSHHFHN